MANSRLESWRAQGGLSYLHGLRSVTAFSHSAHISMLGQGLLLGQLFIVLLHVILKFRGQLFVNREEIFDFISVVLHHLLEQTQSIL